MKKVIFVSPSLTDGGSERVISLLASEFSKKGYDVDLLLVRDKKATYSVHEAVKITQFHAKSANRILKMLQRLRFMRRFFKNNPADAVVSFMYDINFITLLTTVGLHKNVIISERGDPASEGKNKMVAFGKKIFYPRASKIVFQTPNARDYFKDKIKKRGVVIPNPVMTAGEPYMGPRSKKIVAAGRLVKQKNFPMLLNAYAMLLPEFPEYLLVIYGKGGLLNELKQQSHRLNIEDKVEFPGYVADVQAQMRDAALYVSSSDYEGISNSMLEALAMGIPSVCTDCPVGGAAMMIKDGVNGLLVPVGDTTALYKAMKRVLSSMEFSEQLSAEAQKIRQDFSIEKITKDWEKLI